MKKNCTKCSQVFEITQKDLNFYDRISPLSDGKKYQIPIPKFCPECRHQRRLSFRNERYLYGRKCGLCKKHIITTYSPDKPYKTYCQNCWWGDNWDPLVYGRNFDFSKPFFDQLQNLMIAIPRSAVMNFNSVENCEYTNFQNDSKNCYLTFGSGFMEDSMYCNWCYYAKNIVDCSYCSNSELDYMNVDCNQTYKCIHCQDCRILNECEHCIDCRNCQNCFGCVGLRNKEYHIFNKPFDKKTYITKVAELKNIQNTIFIELEKLKLRHPHLSNRIVNSENCTGDDIEHCKNCQDCFGIKNSEDCAYCYDVIQSKDNYDVNRHGLSELVYEICGGGWQQKTIATFGAGHLHSAEYILESINSHNIFGCVGLKQKSYCIFNKQYGKKEYENLRSKIMEHMIQTGEWGEYFPSTLSPFGYNETVAQEFFPLTEEEARAQGFKWCEFKSPAPKASKIIPASKLPLNIHEVSDDILDAAIECEISKKPFKIIKQELAFYRKIILLYQNYIPTSATKSASKNKTQDTFGVERVTNAVNPSKHPTLPLVPK